MISLSPHPDGKRFALTFVDDTDFSSRENTEPVYDFLHQVGLCGTKTVWVRPAKRTSAFREDLARPAGSAFTGATLEDPDYLAFVRKVEDLGFEIALHGISAGNSMRSEIIEGLARCRELLGRIPEMNIFHCRNLENLYSGAAKLDSLILRAVERITDHSDYQGHREGAPYFWGDIVRETFRYVRLPFHTISDPNTLRVCPAMPFHDPRRPWVRRWFVNSDAFDVGRFNRLLAPANIDRIARQSGACLVYTHFGMGFARTRNGRRFLDPDFVRTVEGAMARPGVWSASCSALLDRLHAVRQVTWRQTGRELMFEYGGEVPLLGLTVRLPRGGSVVSPDGKAIKILDSEVILPCLDPGERVLLETSWTADASSSPPVDTITPREYRRIEWVNYRGRVEGKLKDRLDRFRSGRK
jgi:hypothetical protein